MEDESRTNKEPFKAQDTPEPPQHVDPRKRMQDEKAAKSPDAKMDRNSEKPNEDEKPKLLGESETEIDDETTI